MICCGLCVSGAASVSVGVICPGIIVRVDSGSVCEQVAYGSVCGARIF